MRTTVPAPPVATHGRGLAALPATLPRTDSSQVQWKLIAVGCTRAVESVARPAYTVWVYHGETYPARQSDICQSTEDEDRVAEIDRMDEMIDDVHDAYVSVEEEDPEPTAQAFFQMLSAATQPLHEHTQFLPIDHSFRSDSNSFLSNTTVSNEPPLRLSGQEIRARGDSTSRGVPRHLTREEWNAAMLYVLTNLTEVDDYIGKFIDEEWTRRGIPTRQQQENILRNGAGRDRPNFVSWFYQQVISLAQTLLILYT
ncbi:hypothetical protein OsJ_11786 [Oryza sativa Japonica Group]|uniref:Uncharacterized protein n=1 Tax=Oryza sativa subsp. japonica TaxID=39947 RepID=A3AKJ4_ORYSJ|nr:hypothetical protein OsJ_11786 [Oryza sativa Japonica Group]